MKPDLKRLPPAGQLPRWRLWMSLAALMMLSSTAEASMFHGETLDKIADGITIVVLIVAPIIAIALFWMVHILPEKIAEKKGHPQAKAIQCLCLLSLVFGGLLWPLAWLWTYTKPTLHKLAYGTDVVHEHETPKSKLERLRRELAEAEKLAAAEKPVTAEKQAGGHA